jgi:hypothetical protein
MLGIYELIFGRMKTKTTGAKTTGRGELDLEPEKLPLLYP